MKLFKYNETKFKILSIIHERGLGVGDQLPTERELANVVGCSIVPVRHALDDLVRMGMVEKIHGRGSFIIQEIEPNQDHRSSVGVVIIGSYDNINHNNMLSNALEQHDASAQVYYVGQQLDPAVIERLRKCDKFIITGLVNNAWVELISSMNKPVVQVGSSAHTQTIARVDYDWGTAIKLTIQRLKEHGCKRFGLVLADYRYISYSETLCKIFQQNLYDCGLPFHPENLYVLNKNSEMADMEHFARGQTEEMDVLLVEFSPFLTYLFHLQFEHHLRSKKMVLLNPSNVLTQDFEYLHNWGVVTFPPTMFNDAADMLFNEPLSTMERNKVTLIKPRLYGKIFEEGMK